MKNNPYLPRKKEQPYPEDICPCAECPDIKERVCFCNHDPYKLPNCNECCFKDWCETRKRLINEDQFDAD